MTAVVLSNSMHTLESYRFFELYTLSTHCDHPECIQLILNMYTSHTICG